MTPSRSRYDAIVVGGGHNGLVTAWMLARAGRSVLVAEAREIVGGACTTEEIVSGHRCSTTSYVCSLLLPEIVERMDLARHGYEVIPATHSFVPFPDGRHLLLGGDPREEHASVAQFSTADARRLQDYRSSMEAIAGVLRPILTTRPPDLRTISLEDLRAGAAGLRRIRQLGQRDRGLLVNALTMSAVDFLSEWFESNEILGAMAAGGTIGIPGGPRTPGTAFVLLHYALGEAGGSAGSWGFVRGGMGTITQAMAAACIEEGVEIVTSTPVSAIEVRGGSATAVVLVGERRIEAGVVASNADPRRTFAELVDERSLPAEFLSAIRRYRMTGNSAKLNLAVSRRPSFAALPGDGPHLTGEIQMVGSGLDALDRGHNEYRAGSVSSDPYLDVAIQSTVDPSLAPPDHHVISVSAKYVPSAAVVGKRSREALTERLLAKLETYAPGLRESIVGSQLLTPHDYERVYGLSGGSIGHGDMDASQLFVSRPIAGWARYRTPVEGLYLCGAGAHPGGGVSGAPGLNAARTILEDGPPRFRLVRRRRTRFAMRRKRDAN